MVGKAGREYARTLLQCGVTGSTACMQAVCAKPISVENQKLSHDFNVVPFRANSRLSKGATVLAKRSSLRHRQLAPIVEVHVRALAPCPLTETMHGRNAAGKSYFCDRPARASDTA
jgi:hypothetical protein